MSDRLAIAILAAGGATRFGGGKLDADLAGKRLGCHVLDTVLSLNLGTPIIITSDIPPAFAREAALHGLAALLPNRRSADGLGSSVALAATHAIRTEASGLLVVLADMPLISPGTLAHLAAISGRASAVRHADGQPGIPACFPPDWFADLQNLGGERGASALLRERKDVQVLAVAPHELSDVDTPDQLAGVAAALIDQQDHSSSVGPKNGGNPAPE